MGLMLLAGAGLGLLSFLATDEQLRNLQFWLLGNLGGARWSAVALVSALVLVAGVPQLLIAASGPPTPGKDHNT